MFSPKTLRVYGLKGFFMVLAAVSCISLMRGPADAATLQVPSTQYPTIQSAINAANLGDTIIVEAGRTYTENLVLRHKSSGSGWITIQSSRLNLLPAEGNRVSPSDATNMPKLQSTDLFSAVISTQSGSTPSHHYKLIGLEIVRRTNSPASEYYNLINLGTEGSSQNTLAKVPTYFVIDRCYIHGLDGADTRRGVNISARYVEVLNSYFSKFHSPGSDSQAILGWNTPGDIVIRNNYVEGASENILFGGAEITIPNTVITNILIEYNHVVKPLSWRNANPQLVVKNLIEFKNGADAVIRYNIFENVWAEAQDGSAVVLTPRVDTVNSRVQNIKFEYNIFKNVGGVFQMLSENEYSDGDTLPLKDIYIENNLALSSGTANGNEGRLSVFSEGGNQISENIVMRHNTFIMGGNGYRRYQIDGSDFISNLVFDSNIVATPSGSFDGFWADGVQGTAALNRAARSWTFNNNVLQRGGTGYPTTSTYVTNIAGFGFKDVQAGDYELKTNSPYKGAAPGGKDIGADMAGLKDKTKCVESGKTSDCVGARGVSFSNYDFDGDGRADVAVFRPSSSIWYLNKSSEGFGGMQWGVPTDQIAPADYDGDGKTDIAVFRPESNRWYILKSSTMTYDVVYFGMTGDIPVQADYDGDGKADVAVWRPSTGIWYRLNSSNGQFTGYHFGLGTDRPAVGDYDGDGIADYAVFRPSTGVWYLQKSTEGFYAVRFGLPTDTITPADFDGDGKTDIAVFRASTGVWYRLERGSATNFSAFRFGISEDIPSPADFDGDGKADIAVFRPSTGVWYLQKSTEGFHALNFGMNGDVPISAAFAR